MIRWLLLVLFVLIFMASPLGLGATPIPGLSVKNGLLYLLIAKVTIDAILMQGGGARVPAVMVSYGLLVFLSIFSWLVVWLVFDFQNYSVINGAISLKTELVDPFLMLIVFFFLLESRAQVMWLLPKIVWFVILANIISIADAFALIDVELLTLNFEGRLEGFLGQPNEYGAFIALTFPLLVAFTLTSKNVQRAYGIIGLVITFLALILTFSRGSMVGMLTGTLVCGIYLRDHISGRAVSWFLAIFFVTTIASIPLIFAAGFGDLFIERLSLATGDTHTITTGRSTIWIQALKTMLDQPLSLIWGYGWNSYTRFEELRLSTHSVYLNYLFSLGIIGLFVLLTTFFLAIVALRKVVVRTRGDEKTYAIAILVGLVSLLLASIFSETEFVGSLMWALVGAGLKLVQDDASEFARSKAAGQSLHS